MFRSIDSLGAAFSAIVAASLLGLGAGALAAPRALAKNYGIPVEDATGIAYLRGLGMRDAAIGLMVLAFLVRRDREALATAVGFSALVGASDFILVANASGGTAKASLAIHGTGTVGLLAGYALIRAGR